MAKVILVGTDVALLEGLAQSLLGFGHEVLFAATVGEVAGALNEDEPAIAVVSTESLENEELGATVLYVTHDQIEAMTMAARIGVIRDGRLLQLGTPREIYETPATPFAADFIGQVRWARLLDGRRFIWDGRGFSGRSASYVPSPNTGCSLRRAINLCSQRSNECGCRSCASTFTAWKP